MHSRLLPAAFGLAFLAGQASAADSDPCGKGLVCANAPQMIVSAMTGAKMMPKLNADTDGDPMIDGVVSGSCRHSSRIRKRRTEPPSRMPALASRRESR